MDFDFLSTNLRDPRMGFRYTGVRNDKDGVKMEETLLKDLVDETQFGQFGLKHEGPVGLRYSMGI